MSSAMEAISFRIVPAERPAAEPTHHDHASREEIARLRAALDLSSDGVLFLSPLSLTVLDANKAACMSLGLTRSELLTLSWPEFATGVTRGEAGAAVADVIHGRTPLVMISIEYQHRRGFAFPVEVQLRRLDTGPQSVLVAVSQDVSERRRLEKLSQHDAFHDALTGLPNRPLLECRLQQALDAATRTGISFAVIFVDLDRFKEVNDTLGHLAGDRLLKIAAQRLSAGVRPGDLVTRFGGDEFVVLLDQLADADEAAAVAERIRRVMNAPVVLNGQTQSLSASVGVALPDETCTSVEDVLESADRAMYRDKHAERRASIRREPALDDRGDPSDICVILPARPR